MIKVLCFHTAGFILFGTLGFVLDLFLRTGAKFDVNSRFGPGGYQSFCQLLEFRFTATAIFSWKILQKKHSASHRKSGGEQSENDSS